MQMETTVVKKYRGGFLVSNIEDVYIKVSASQVDWITNRVPDVEGEEVAILLATITEARVVHSRAGWKNNTYKKIDEKAEQDAIVHLLQHYDIDSLNRVFEEMKYYEIKRVLEADNPIMMLREMI